jgi:syntaxin-binding protein 1
LFFCFVFFSLQADKSSLEGLTPQQIEEEKSNNTLVLSEDDSLWVDFRHRHIGDVMHDVTEKFREFKGVNRMAKLQTDENSSVKDMIQAMKDMPEYKNMMKKYHKHMSIAQECMNKFDKKKLKELGELEQDMATGLNNDGKAVNVKQIKSDLVKMCQDPQIG